MTALPKGCFPAAVWMPHRGSEGVGICRLLSSMDLGGSTRSSDMMMNPGILSNLLYKYVYYI